MRKGWPRREPRNIILRMQRWLTAFVFHVKNFQLASNLLLYCMCLVQVLFSFSRHRRWHGRGCRETGCREPTVDAAPLQVGSQPTFTSAYFSTKLAPPGNYRKHGGGGFAPVFPISGGGGGGLGFVPIFPISGVLFTMGGASVGMGGGFIRGGEVFVG